MNPDAPDRPVYSPAAPDYACPRVQVMSYRDSASNFKEIKPAGIRRGDQKLPDKYLNHDQPQYALGARVDEQIWHNRDRIFRKANTADM